MIESVLNGAEEEEVEEVETVEGGGGGRGGRLLLEGNYQAAKVTERERERESRQRWRSCGGGQRGVPAVHIIIEHIRTRGNEEVRCALMSAAEPTLKPLS